VIYRTAPFSITPFFDAEWPWNTNRDSYTTYATLSLRMTLSDLEWLSKVFNDTKRGAVSMWQLSFLLSRVCKLTRDIDSTSVRASRSGILWKRLNVLSQFLHHSVGQSFYSFVSIKCLREIPTWSPRPLHDNKHC